MSNKLERPQIGKYLGDQPSNWYYDLNGESRPKPEVHANRRLIKPGLPADNSVYLEHGNVKDIESSVKVMPLPICIAPEMSRRAIREAKVLREQGVLTPLRGGRKTDLPRPLSEKTRDILLQTSPNLVKIIQMVEEGIKGGNLFIRSIKFDDSRASTTQAEGDRTKPNLHFDAGKSSLNDYSDQVFQFYVNISQIPRVFSVHPVPITEMISILTKNGLLAEGEGMTLPAEEVLAKFIENYDVKIQRLVIESGQLAIFDGRRFAHDAGKPMMRKLRQGQFAPSNESDLILALDTPDTGYHAGYYDPEQSFLTDPGTPAWWAMLAKYSNT